MTRPKQGLDAHIIEELVRRIVEAVHPERVFLFGSRALGDARPESDIDLLVIAHSTQPRYRRSSVLYEALSDIITPMDILVYTPEEVEEWSQVPQAFITTAVREGKVLYEKQN